MTRIRGRGRAYVRMYRAMIFAQAAGATGMHNASAVHSGATFSHWIKWAEAGGSAAQTFPDGSCICIAVRCSFGCQYQCQLAVQIVSAGALSARPRASERTNVRASERFRIALTVLRAHVAQG